jgi:uncharacterized membrane protein
MIPERAGMRALSAFSLVSACVAAVAFIAACGTAELLRSLPHGVQLSNTVLVASLVIVVLAAILGALSWRRRLSQISMVICIGVLLAVLLRLLSYSSGSLPGT